MDMWRRAWEGKMAEILGPRAVERDRFARLIRYRGDMKAEYESYAPDARQIIEAFVRGVNAQIALSKDRLPIEFQLTGARPEPWTPEVCLTRLAGYVMTRNASTEILRAQLVREFGKEFVDEWMETEPKKKIETPEGLDLHGIDSKILAAANEAGRSVRFNPNDGSNNWVIDGTMSATGKPILANDPHRTIALPSLRYLVHLVGPGIASPSASPLSASTSRTSMSKRSIRRIRMNTAIAANGRRCASSANRSKSKAKRSLAKSS
jgi:penicillin amidase